MLPSFIIAEIKKRETEREQRQRDIQPTLRVPEPESGPDGRSEDELSSDEEQERGVVVIDLGN